MQVGIENGSKKEEGKAEYCSGKGCFVKHLEEVFWGSVQNKYRDMSYIGMCGLMMLKEVIILE